MQLFVPFENLTKCAMVLDDKRLNVQIKEAAQIMSTAIWMKDCDIAETLYANGKIYLPTHEFHPICKNAGNMYYNIFKLFTACIDEYRYRFGKMHGSAKYLWELLYWQKLFTNDMPFQNHTTNHKHIENVYESYRKELTFKWNHDKVQPKWTKRSKPNF